MEPGKVVFEGKTVKGLPIVIRYLKEEDTDALRDYINVLSKEQTFIRFQGEQVSFEEEKEYVERFVRRIKRRLAVKLLAFTGRKLIGDGRIDLSEKTEKHVGRFGLSVAIDYREKGVGTILTQKILEEAEKNLPDLRIVVLGVFADNPVAIAMYEKFGFKEYGRLPEGVFRKGKYVDHISMYKKIRSS